MKFRLPIIILLEILFLGGSTSALCAQEEAIDSLSLSVSQPADWRLLLENLSEMEDFENIRWDDYEQELEELAQHPFNVNTITREQLEELPFLSATQIEDILHYIYRYGQMRSLGELALIPSLDWMQSQLLGRFLYVGESKKQTFPSLAKILKYGKHELVGMLKVPFYERKGDVQGYMGYPYKHALRYQMRYGDYVKLGIVASQDAGEPFFSGKNTMGYDFYSFYFQLKKWGRWKNITLGRYRLHEGLGLILNNDFGLGKSAVLSSLGGSTDVIRVHSSRSSANYLQGAAATYSLVRGLDVTAFVSYRKIDATLTPEGGIKTILETGLHRSLKEIEKQDVASNTLLGGHIGYRSEGFHLGATAFYTSFSRPLTPANTQLYKRFAPQGYRFWNASMDYGYISHRWNITGETATGDCGSWATLNSVSYMFTERFSLVALHRFYSARFYSLFGNSFSEGSEVQDENGAYIGFTWSPAYRWSISAYSDFAYFAWPKYQTKESTQSWDNRVSVLYHPSKAWTIGGYLRYKNKAGTATNRMHLDAAVAKKNWNARTSFYYVMSQETTGGKSGERSQGYMLHENIAYHWRRLRLSGSVGYFHTSDFSSRIFVYEPGLLYQMSFGSYYGHGMRCSAVARMELGKHLLVIAKLGSTHYFDRDHISSGLQEISASRQTDLEMQVKWKW